MSIDMCSTSPGLYIYIYILYMHHSQLCAAAWLDSSWAARTIPVGFMHTRYYD